MEYGRIAIQVRECRSDGNRTGTHWHVENVVLDPHIARDRKRSRCTRSRLHWPGPPVPIAAKGRDGLIQLREQGRQGHDHHRNPGGPALWECY